MDLHGLSSESSYGFRFCILPIMARIHESVNDSLVHRVTVPHTDLTCTTAPSPFPY